MIKELLEQLAPLDAQIAALKGSGNDMDRITAHASELAELAVEEDEILRTCGPLTAEDRVFLARHPDRPHIDETVSALFTDFFEQRGDRQCKEDAAILGGIARFHGSHTPLKRIDQNYYIHLFLLTGMQRTHFAVLTLQCRISSFFSTVLQG